MPIFQALNPNCRPVFLEQANPDTRNYHVSTQRMKEAGVVPEETVRKGAEEMIEAIVTGRIADPEAIYYRNAKWLKELTELQHRDHSGLNGHARHACCGADAAAGVIAARHQGFCAKTVLEQQESAVD